MRRALARLVAIVFTAAGALGVVVIGGWLTLDAIDASYRRTVQDAQLDVLNKQAESDPTRAPVLQEVFETHTAWEVARDQRVERLAWALLGATALLVVSGKWLHGLRRTGAMVPADVRARCAVDAVENHSEAVVPIRCQSDAPVENRCHKESGQVAAPPVDDASDVDIAEVDALIACVGTAADRAIPLLHALQERFRYLPTAALRRICERTAITPAQLASVASFYPQFRRTPRGEHLITVCHGTACHVAGAERLTDELRRQLRIGPGADTDARREFTIQEVPCLGCCTLAPVVQTDGVTHGHVSANELGDLIHECRCTGDGGRREVEASAASTSDDQESEPAGEIRLGMGSCCVANGSGAVHDALEAALAQTRIDATVKRVGCVGMCHQTPFVEIRRPGHEPVMYSHVRAEQAGAIVRRHFRSQSSAAWLRNALVGTLDSLRDGRDGRVSPECIELRDPPVAAFLGPQEHIATEHRGVLDPLDLDEYERHEGFAALRRAVGMKPDQIVAEIRTSGLRGRGGAGFPTAQKWQIVQQAAGPAKYIICNGDEGDPGAFMDRMLMESYPYRILEGVAIAALATGAAEAVFYIRAEYPLAVKRIEAAIAECERRGILGDEPARQRAGAARARSARGGGVCVWRGDGVDRVARRGSAGSPRLRPPYPAERGLHDRPTLGNNVETFAVVPWILRHGGSAFAALGTERSSGTKVFALAGKVARGGLIEVPMGITIRQIVRGDRRRDSG